MLPYGRQSISQEDVDAVVAVLKGDWLTTGPQVESFESALAAVCGGHRVISCSSGTAALHIAYSALGLGPGDEIVVPAMTFVATASCASWLGATIRFADVDPTTGLVDPASVQSLTNERTRAIVAVDYAGHPCDYTSLQALSSATGVALVADAAHSIGAAYRGCPVGDLADVTTLSFFATKNLTTGEGGAVVAKTDAIAKGAAEFRNIGLIRDPARFVVPETGGWHQEVHEPGLNYRLTDIACALGVSQLRRLPAFAQRRAEIKARYDAALSGLAGVSVPRQLDNVEPVWHLYPLRIRDGMRQRVYDRMRADGIGVQVNYMPVYWHPVYERMGYQRGTCPSAEDFYAQQLSLPIYPDLGDDQVDQVIESLHRALS